ncbi:hypothetical protein [Nocardia sp. NBC_00403]|uniref:hypothetical protein n=1 Tax=Nocardia sp. NBC_00403 TaxID=2975990 RepID=UPI002E23C252
MSSSRHVVISSSCTHSGASELSQPLDLLKGLQSAGSLCLDGLLAGAIVNGGAHERYRGPARDAMALASAAVEALTQNRFEDFRMDVSHEAWAPWFEGVVFDQTYVLTDTANAEITVLCITDTS